jgi:uncharacterized cupredoxin-like copper-binding protein/mono/diheme cytochrome c family protein
VSGSNDGRTGRELTPRPPAEQGVERFTAPETAHTIGLSETRAAQIVRQTGNARAIAFLAVLLIVLFIPIYWFYDLGVPAVANTSRLANEATTQQVTSIQRGELLFLANCARCHGTSGQGGVGPPLNDQGKLYNAVTPAGAPGAGHLNPNYIRNVLTVGGRYVCGDPNSLMPIWSDTNGGPLNYQQINDLIAFITASSDVSWTYTPPVSEVGAAAGSAAPSAVHHGWRDPAYTPPPGATPVPACWRNPSGVIGGSGGTAASPAPAASAPAITNPGTAANPRVIKLDETAQLSITDASGQQVSNIYVKKGETVRFEVTNTAGFTHNFYVGLVSDLQSSNTADLKGIPDFSSGTQTLDYTFTQDGQFGFGCLVPGHYTTMHGTITIEP